MITICSSFFGAFAVGFFCALLFVLPLKAVREIKRTASISADVSS